MGVFVVDDNTTNNKRYIIIFFIISKHILKNIFIKRSTTTKNIIFLSWLLKNYSKTFKSTTTRKWHEPLPPKSTPTKDCMRYRRFNTRTLPCCHHIYCKYVHWLYEALMSRNIDKRFIYVQCCTRIDAKIVDFKYSCISIKYKKTIMSCHPVPCS